MSLILKLLVSRRRILCSALLIPLFVGLIGNASLNSTSHVFAATPIVPAFPGAEGFGAMSVGGRGGRVIEVTNLNDSGPGSLRAAIDASGPRIVIFQTGGTIVLMSGLKITNPYITIAGQTAPGGGITLKNHSTHQLSSLQIWTHDVIIRYLRFRPGPGDNISGNTDSLEIRDGHNIIIDHTSISWSVDEAFSTWSENSEPGKIYDVTMQWSIISEALRNSVHPSGAHSMGALLGRKTTGVSLHHNLMAHNDERNPRIKGGSFDIVNNVVYNFGEYAAWFTNTNAPLRANYVANYIKPGLNSNTSRPGVVLPASGDIELYVQGNIDHYRVNDTIDDWLSVGKWSGPNDITRYAQILNRHEFPIVTTTSALEAYDQVLAGAGVTVPIRDTVDQRIVDDVINGTGTIIDDPSQVGGYPNLPSGTPIVDSDHDGMPDDWENLRGFDPNDASDGSQDPDGDGYTNVEDYLNSLVPAEGFFSDETPPSMPENLSTLAISDSEISLTWSPSNDAESGISDYTVFRDGSLISSTIATSFIDRDLEESTEYAYQVLATNGAGIESPLTAMVLESTNADITPPTIVSVKILNSTKVSLLYSEPVEETSATISSNYQISPEIIVAEAIMGPNAKSITLTTSELTPGSSYILKVSNVTDTAKALNLISAGTEVEFSFSFRVTAGLQVLYDFEEGTGNVVLDVSGVGIPLDLVVINEDLTQWVPGGLSVNSATIVRSSQAASKIINAVKTTNEITVEAWVKPANTSQSGPARIVTLSADSKTRNLTLGQSQELYSFRLRTTGTNNNGLPTFNSSPGSADTSLTHVVYTRSNTGDAKIYVDGVESVSGLVDGDLSNWDDSYKFGLANEFTLDRPWLGELHLVAVYDRALDSDEVGQNFGAGPNPGSSIAPDAEPNDPSVSVVPTAEISEGEALNLSGTVSNPNNVALTTTVDYGDGSSVEPLVLNGGAFDLNHLYLDNGSFTVVITATDGKGSDYLGSVQVGVSNLAPTVNAGPDVILNSGETFLRTGFFDDIAADTWTATVDYGDGTGVQPLQLLGMSYVLDHTYESEGIYTIVVSITDDDGGTGSDRIEIIVTATPPTLPGMSAASNDLDGDGLTEDINGNGRLDFSDIVALFEYLDSPDIQTHPEFYDFNRNGVIDMADVISLFDTVVNI